MSKDLTGVWKKQYDYRFISSEDISGEVTVEITRVTEEEVHQPNKGKSKVVTIWFKGSDKGMILNKTNCKTISKVVGSPRFEDWVGFKVIIHAKEIKAFGDTVNALRVKMQKVS